MISDEDRLAAANRLHDAALENNARLRDELAAARAERDEQATAMGDLLDSVKALEAEVKGLAAYRDTLLEAVAKATVERDEARAALDRVREVADRLRKGEPFDYPQSALIHTDTLLLVEARAEGWIRAALDRGRS